MWQEPRTRDFRSLSMFWPIRFSPAMSAVLERMPNDGTAIRTPLVGNNRGTRQDPAIPKARFGAASELVCCGPIFRVFQCWGWLGEGRWTLQ